MEEGRLARPRGMVWGGKREEGSGWGTHVYLWRIHVDIWQNQYSIDLPNPGIEPRSSTLQTDSLPAELPEKSKVVI